MEELFHDEVDVRKGERALQVSGNSVISVRFQRLHDHEVLSTGHLAPGSWATLGKMT